jgi:hypothetical protein
VWVYILPETAHKHARVRKQCMSSLACSVRLAGERLCDERATCQQWSSGGVRCRCSGASLRSATFPDDGSECIVVNGISVVLETNYIHVRLVKPGATITRRLHSCNATSRTEHFKQRQ